MAARCAWPLSQSTIPCAFSIQLATDISIVDPIWYRISLPQFFAQKEICLRDDLRRSGQLDGRLFFIGIGLK